MSPRLESIFTVLDYEITKETENIIVFKSNFNQYFIYREDFLTYKIFNGTSFKHIEPIELLNEFWLPNIVLKSNQSIEERLSKLVPITFNKSLGIYLGLKKLQNTTYAENNVSQKCIDKIITLEYFSANVFLTRNGLAIFSYPKLRTLGTFPNGIVYFSQFNNYSNGNSIIYLPRINKELLKKTTEIEHQNILFSPYTIIECYNKGFSMAKDNFIVINDVQKLQKLEIDLENSTIHLRPTKTELTNFIQFVSKIAAKENIRFLVETDDYNNIYISLNVFNYSKIRAFEEKFDFFLNNLDLTSSSKEKGNNFSIKLLKKNIKLSNEKKVDFVQFKFENRPENLITFINVFLLHFFENRFYLNKITQIHYDNEFPIILEEMIPLEFFIPLDSPAEKNQDDNDYIFDDDYSDY